MTPRNKGRCVHVGDVLVLETRPAGSFRRPDEIPDLPVDIEHDSYRVLRKDAEEALYREATDGSIESHRKERARERLPGPPETEPDYDSPVLLHEP
jgi:hypothetical protein